jgi:hypothetical protein
MLDGFLEIYYPYNQLRSKVFYFRNKRTGSALFYNDSGDFSEYKLFDFQGNLRFIRECFDGGVCVDKGSIIGQFLHSRVDSLSAKDTVNVLLTFAKPPQTK